MNYLVDMIAKCFNNWLYWNYSFKFFDSFMSHIGGILAVSVITLLFGIGVLMAIFSETRR